MTNSEHSIVISGSRDYPHLELVRFVVRIVKESGAKEILVGYDEKKGTPRGVDKAVYNACKEFGVPVRCFPPRWTVNGRKLMNAGMVRNCEMIDQGSRVIAIWSDASPGTAHAIVYAHQQGKLFRIYGVGEEDPIVLLKKAYAVRKTPFIEPEVPGGETAVKE